MATLLERIFSRRRLLKGASDIIVLIKEDGELIATPIVVRFGYEGLEGLGVNVSIRVSEEGEKEVFALADLKDELKVNEKGEIYVYDQKEHQHPKSRECGEKCQFLLSSAQLKKMHLNLGRNRIRFSVDHVLFESNDDYVDTGVFVYNYDQISNNIVVTDIDGTITKSDFPGIVPGIGRYWLQKDCIRLYRAISKNNYIFIYLTARPLGDYKDTKDYIKSVKESKLHLPEGPVILNKKGAIHSLLYADEFKAEVMTDLKYRVFSGFHDVIRASFGNAETDMIASSIANINEDRIFKATFMRRLTVSLGLQKDSKLFTNYGQILQDVHSIFPKKEVRKVEERRISSKIDWTLRKHIHYDNHHNRIDYVDTFD